MAGLLPQPVSLMGPERDQQNTLRNRQSQEQRLRERWWNSLSPERQGQLTGVEIDYNHVPDPRPSIVNPNIDPASRGDVLPHFGLNKKGYPTLIMPNWAISAGQSTQLPKAAAEGYVPTFEQGVQATADMAVGGGLLSRAPAGAVGMFAGKRAENISQLDLFKKIKPGRLEDAQKALAAGMPQKEAWKKFGWRQDIDGQWKFELSDHKAKIIQEAYIKIKKGKVGDRMLLEDLLDHPELFDAYPQLRKLTVEIEGIGAGGGFGEGRYFIDDSILSLPSAYPRRFGTYNKTAMMSSVLHEIQHWVQAKEGWGRGSHVGQHPAPLVPPSVKARVARLRKQIEQMPRGSPERFAASTLYHKMKEPYTEFGRYRAAGMEPESVNTSTRAKFGPRKRADVFPDETLGVQSNLRHHFEAQPAIPSRYLKANPKTGAVPGLLMKSIQGRADQMALKAEDRFQPRGGKGLMSTSTASYKRNPMHPEENLPDLYPRRPDAGPYPLKDRVRPIIDLKDELAANIAEKARPAIGTPAQYFYHTGELYETALKHGLSKKQAQQFVHDWAEHNAATSPRTNTEFALRNASLVMAKKEAGIPHRKIVGPGTGGISESGYPMMTSAARPGKVGGAAGQHGKLLDELELGGGFNKDTNPKPNIFSRNIAGNLSGSTIDVHAMRAILDALNDIRPGGIPPQFIKPKFHQAYKDNPADLDPAKWIKDGMQGATIDEKDLLVEYGPFADVMDEVAKLLKVEPAEAQSMTWFTQSRRTGVQSPNRSLMELLNDRIDVTAQVLGMTPEEVAKKFFKRQISLSANPATAAAPSLLSRDK